MAEENHKYLNTGERRLEIAEAAREIILEKGFEGLRTREIAARVGINISTLHYHVPTKKALIELVADSMRQEFHEHYERLGRKDSAPLEELRLLIRDYKEVMLNKPELLQLMDALGHRAAFDQEIALTIGEMRRHWYSLFVKVLQRGKDSGDFRSSLNPEAAAHMIVGALVAFQYKPRSLLPLFDSVGEEIIRSIIAT
ncbi:MAG TPA: TetR/AcrR family transcriptional regulator [Ensifer sp.]|nr:TetR/AcrR family transcriptional regulator [Ensifer sp.]